jgi:hypothetical protein
MRQGQQLLLRGQRRDKVGQVHWRKRPLLPIDTQPHGMPDAHINPDSPGNFSTTAGCRFRRGKKNKIDMAKAIG